MSWIQRFVKSVLPRSWSSSIEEHSRAWIMKCPCGHQQSVWEAGGIRYRAAGKPTRMATCPRCGPTLHTLEKRVAAAD